MQSSPSTAWPHLNQMVSKPVVALGATAATGAVGAIAADGLSLPTALADLSAAGLLIVTVAFIIISLFRGWIVVKLHYETLLARAIAAEEANVKLSDALATLTATNSVQANAMEKNTAVGSTVEKVMSALQDARSHTAGGQT